MLSNALHEFINETISELYQYENRARAREPKAQAKFEHADKLILFSVWKLEHTRNFQVHLPLIYWS